MENKNDLLTVFSEPETISNKKFVRVVIILYSLYNIIYLAAFFISVQIGKIELSMLFSTKLIALKTLTFRLLPIIALVLFIAKKKAGWIMVLLLSIIDLLYRIMFIIGIGLNFRVYMHISPYLLAGLLLPFLFSLSVTIFILFRSVTLEFKISDKVRLFTILSAIIIFIVLQFYSMNLLQKLFRQIN